MDCLEGMKLLDDNSVDSIVTDPPYELGFMGKKWDSTGIAYNVDVWRECLRVLKHGGHLLAFGGTRTYHRMACAIEDAGFEIRDQMQWIYGSGFPKSMDISKAIDKKFGAEREVIGRNPNSRENSKTENNLYKLRTLEKTSYITLPSTDGAKQWDGWGTCLKPANEPICVARKPISEKTIADNVLKWGTGGINIDGCRIEYQSEKDFESAKGGDSGSTKCNIFSANGKKQSEKITLLGRFPANVILDEEAGKLLDEQSGILKSGALKPYQENHQNASSYKMNRYKTFIQPANEGGASRFFYCAKASKKERGDSKHPTVKPLSLMRYLCRLITPPEGIVLDPFAGSGTTLEAAILEGFNVVGIEKEHDYIPDIRRRIERAQLNTQAMDMELFLFSEQGGY